MNQNEANYLQALVSNNINALIKIEKAEEIGAINEPLTQSCLFREKHSEASQNKSLKHNKRKHNNAGANNQNNGSSSSGFNRGNVDDNKRKKQKIRKKKKKNENAVCY